MNKVILMGRLTRDPDVRYTQGEDSQAVARYTLAVDRRGKKREDGDNADFISCVAFRKNGEFAEKYLRKGTQILIYGHIQTGSYTNREGQKVYTTDVVVDEHYFTESKAAQAAGNNAAANTANNAANNATTTDNALSSEGFMNIPDSVDDFGLPFN